MNGVPSCNIWNTIVNWLEAKFQINQSSRKQIPPSEGWDRCNVMWSTLPIAAKACIASVNVRVKLDIYVMTDDSIHRAL